MNKFENDQNIKFFFFLEKRILFAEYFELHKIILTICKCNRIKTFLHIVLYKIMRLDVLTNLFVDQKY